jgi:2-oxoglutarate ferredoxin oxidoreductase subunit delta
MHKTEEKITINEKLCKGCYYCVDVCPKNVLVKSTKMGPKGYVIVEAENPEECIECGLCERICPDFAISILKTNKI